LDSRLFRRVQKIDLISCIGEKNEHKIPHTEPKRINANGDYSRNVTPLLCMDLGL